MALRTLLPVLAILAAAGAAPAAASDPGDAAAGATVFQRQCAQCHAVGAGAENRIGPHLNEVFGRRAGGIADFRYSRPMERAGADGLTWTHETLDAYIDNPRALVSGTRMSYRGLKDAGDRANLIAYLRTLSASNADIPEAEPTLRADLPRLSPEILAIVGDPAYGEYLSSECTTCHLRDGGNEGIPGIVGWPVEDFVAAMHAYKQQLRPHPVMQMMAARLTDDEIAALAAYFAMQD